MFKFSHILALTTCIAVAACIGQTQSNWVKDVQLVQGSFNALVPIINAAVLKKAPQASAAVLKAEATANTELQALAASPVPVNPQTFITDLQNLNNAIPANTISLEDQALISGTLSLANVLLQDFG